MMLKLPRENAFIEATRRAERVIAAIQFYTINSASADMRDLVRFSRSGLSEL